MVTEINFVSLSKTSEVKCGNANRLDDVFDDSVRTKLPKIGSARDREITSVKHHSCCGVRSVVVTICIIGI
ncbi:unnamed protein product [Gordionus sp. m RMFG-2023]